MNEHPITCLQIHNDYQIPGGETKTAMGIADLLESNGIKVIRYYKDNNSFKDKGILEKFIVGVRSIYNNETAAEIETLLEKFQIDFALIHNTMPIISNSAYKVLLKHRVPIIKYIQNYNLICLNGALDHGKRCLKCKENCWSGVTGRCYKASFAFSFVRYISKKEFDKKYLNGISAFMPNSKYVMNRHADYGIDTSRMHVMYNYIEVEPETFSEQNYNSYYLYFGRISREKGIFTAVSAFKKLRDIDLVIMGSGEEETNMLSEISGYDHIKYIGSKSGEELKTVIHNAKCVIVPSEWGDPLPRTVLEAYAHGIPVVGTLSGGIAEMIKDGLGFTFEAGNPEALANAILHFEELEIDHYMDMRHNCFNACKEIYSREEYYHRFQMCLRGIGVLPAPRAGDKEQ